MYLRIDTMDAVLVEFDADGQVRFRDAGWSTPTRQEIRAIIHAAQDEIEHLTDLVDVLEHATQSGHKE
ncbi:MAG: hypothetical protein ACRD1Q_16415 [Vicinamibacterales bacterium]